MLTPQDVRAVQFEKNLRGYRTEDVDRVLDKVEQQLEQDAGQMEALRKPCDEAEQRTAVGCWPFPTYGDLLFGVQ